MLNFSIFSRLPETLATSSYRRPAFFVLVAVGIMCAFGYFLSDPVLYNSPAPSVFIFQWRSFGFGLIAALLQGVILFCALSVKFGKDGRFIPETLAAFNFL
jgi:hypothetical protein